MTELAEREPVAEVVTYTVDPTGGRLVAWARAAHAANQLAISLTRTAFVPAAMKDPGDAAAAILMGDELGLSPIAALRSIYVVHGTPALYARSMVALALSHGHEIWTEAFSDQSVTVCGRRKGSDHAEKSVWTIQRATKAGYTSNKKYAASPQEMLYAKASAEVARKIAADVIAGVAYTVEDLELEEGGPTTTVVRDVTRRVQRAKPEVPEPEIEAAAQAEPEPVALPASEPSDEQRKLMFALLGELGLEDREKYIPLAEWHVGHSLDSTSEMDRREMSEFIDYLLGRLAGDQEPEGDPNA